MTDPARGTRYRSLNDVICFDRIPLTNENADRPDRGTQANSSSINSAHQIIATPHCAAPTASLGRTSHGNIAEGLYKYGFSAACSLWSVVALIHSRIPGLPGPANATGTPPAVARTGGATNEQSLDEYLLAIYQSTSHAHASKLERPPSSSLEEPQPITTNGQLVAVPELGTPPLTVDSPTSSLFEPEYALPDAALPFAPVAQSAVSSEGDLLRFHARAGSNHSQNPNLSAPPEAGNFAREQVTQVAGPPASAAPASTQTERPAASNAGAAGADLLARGRTLLSQGDVASARLLLSRAFDAGASSASFFLAQSYDPMILASRHTYGASADLSKARHFYEHAYRMGVREAEQRVGSLNNGSTRDRGENRQHRFSGHVTQRAE